VEETVSDGGDTVIMKEGIDMPNIDLATLRRVAAMQRRYADGLARQQAERRLDELETALLHERQRRGLEPVTTDTGKVIAWVRTRSQSIGER